MNNLPLSVKSVARLVSNDLILVQPLSSPVGKIFFYDYSLGKYLRILKLKKLIGEKVI